MMRDEQQYRKSLERSVYNRISTQAGMNADGSYKLMIPNEEVREIFKLQIQDWFKRAFFQIQKPLQEFWSAFESGNTAGMEGVSDENLSNSISVFDTKARNE